MPRWFGADAEMDAELRRDFAKLPDRAVRGELDTWLADPRETVALVLALDQLPRNLWRGQARAFSYDTRALEIAQAWIDAGKVRRVEPPLAAFAFLPLEHAEDRAVQRRCVACYEALADRVEGPWREHFDRFCAYARTHRDIVERFGRFPHRNAILGRESTEAERAWLEAGGETFGT